MCLSRFLFAKLPSPQTLTLKVITVTGSVFYIQIYTISKRGDGMVANSSNTLHFYWSKQERIVSTDYSLGIQIPSKKVVWGVFRRLNTFSEGSWIPRDWFFFPPTVVANHFRTRRGSLLFTFCWICGLDISGFAGRRVFHLKTSGLHSNHDINSG